MSKKQARYGPIDRYGPPPGAGMCISVFIVIRPAGRKQVLLGLMKPSQEWQDEWLSGLSVYPENEKKLVFDQWRLPSCYLREGENPRGAVDRVLKDQVNLQSFGVSDTPRVFSYSSKSDWYPGNEHWDLVFAYDVKTGSNKPPENPKWWREMRYYDSRKEIESMDFGWNSDFMHDLNLL